MTSMIVGVVLITLGIAILVGVVGAKLDMPYWMTGLLAGVLCGLFSGLYTGAL